jgi:DNA-binding NarL/FixJ family response regulator
MGHTVIARAMRILLAHGDDLVLAGLRQALADDDGFEVAAEAHEASALVPLVGQTGTEVVLLDAEFPGIGGLEALRRLLAADPAVTVLMTGGPSSREVVEEALATGASGSITDRISTSDLGDAIREAIRSGAPAGQGGGDAELPEGAPHLTPREAAALVAVARGLPNKAIAQELCVSERTVKFHLTSVYRKLGVTNRTEAARWALTQGVAA